MIPSKFAFLKFTEWAKDYGGIFSLKIANETIIVLSNAKIVKEILEDRANETSERPYTHTLDVVTGGNYFAFSGSESQVWKFGRKAMQSLVSLQAVQTHLHVAEKESARLLYDILHQPEVHDPIPLIFPFRILIRVLQHIYTHITRFTYSFMASVLYGKPAPRIDSQDFTLFCDYFHHFTKMLSPGDAAPVDLFPVLKYVPERWAPWKKLWRKTRQLQRMLYFSLLDHTEQEFRHGPVGGGTIMEGLLEKMPGDVVNREMLGYIGGVMLDGGTETSAALIQSLILCLLKSPESLQKAQEELDAVVSRERLPFASDIDHLPYVQALIKEVFRIRSVGPSGVPHAAGKDFQYDEYIIPMGATIFINMWGMMHDPELFERPEEFWPERYLMTPDGTKPGLNKGYTIGLNFMFGCGKRICPGIHLAKSNISLAVMRLLWAFDISPIDGEVTQHWREIEVEYKDV
uniref:Cytochrome P450 n=1 Tax=Psilocybe cubensis TaxID=181762 RepID=A0A8H8CKL1_PSICU